jgi:hypothetical protein
MSADFLPSGNKCWRKRCGASIEDEPERCEALRPSFPHELMREIIASDRAEIASLVRYGILRLRSGCAVRVG